MEKLNNMIGVVVIGRNEGERLNVCLSSIEKDTCSLVYVDSGSTDSSISMAKNIGADVVELDMSLPFTAARARNVGWKKLLETHPNIEYIQFIDGDCELISDWLNKAVQFLDGSSNFGVVCGRRRERFPDKSVYNQLCDEEWDTPIGEAYSCGGDALIRVDVLKKVNGFDNTFIAGEEPEMCFRIRESGFKIMRLDAEMTLHDAAMFNFSQWWNRSKRGGFAYALGAFKHGAGKELFNVINVVRSLIWSSAFVFPLILSLLISPLFLFLYTLFPLQVLKVYLSLKNKSLIPFKKSIFLMLVKIPEAIGIGAFLFKKIFKRKMKLIEYK